MRCCSSHRRCPTPEDRAHSVTRAVGPCHDAWAWDGRERVTAYAEGEFELAHGDSERARSLSQRVRDGHAMRPGFSSDGATTTSVGPASPKAASTMPRPRSRRPWRWPIRRGRLAGDACRRRAPPLSVKAGDVQAGRDRAERAIAMARRLDDGLTHMAVSQLRRPPSLARDRERAGRYLAELATGLRGSRSRRWLADTLETGRCSPNPASPIWPCRCSARRWPCGPTARNSLVVSE